MTGSSLPVGYSLGVLNRKQAAEYVGVSPSLFDEMVANRRMPEAVVLSERRVGWIQRELDAAVAALPRKAQAETQNDITHLKACLVVKAGLGLEVPLISINVPLWMPIAMSGLRGRLDYGHPRHRVYA